MNTFYKKNLTLLLLVIITFANCSSTTKISSSPEGAKVYINNEFKGKTPYIHKDTKIVGSSIVVKLKKENYKEFSTVITKDEEFNTGACVGGVFVLVPFLWIMQYQPEHKYELEKE